MRRRSWALHTGSTLLFAHRRLRRQLGPALDQWACLRRGGKPWFPYDWLTCADNVFVLSGSTVTDLNRKDSSTPRVCRSEEDSLIFCALDRSFKWYSRFNFSAYRYFCFCRHIDILFDGIVEIFFWARRRVARFRMSRGSGRRSASLLFKL